MSNYSGQHDLTKSFSPNVEIQKSHTTMLCDMRFSPEYDSPITVVIGRLKGEYGTWEIEVTEDKTIVRKKHYPR